MRAKLLNVYYFIDVVFSLLHCALGIKKPAERAGSCFLCCIYKTKHKNTTLSSATNVDHLSLMYLRTLVVWCAVA